MMPGQPQAPEQGQELDNLNEEITKEKLTSAELSYKEQISKIRADNLNRKIDKLNKLQKKRDAEDKLREREEDAAEKAQQKQKEDEQKQRLELQERAAPPVPAMGGVPSGQNLGALSPEEQSTMMKTAGIFRNQARQLKHYIVSRHGKVR